VHKYLRFTPLAALVGAAALAGCNDYLTGGDLSNDPNRPSVASATQLFVGVQSNIWALLGSDPARLAGLFDQQFTGGSAQYVALSQSLTIDEQTTNGFFSSLYTGGGLIDARREEALARQTSDSTFLGIAQIQEAIIAGTGADIFGDIVYSQMYSVANPKLDPQLSVYDSVQVVLSNAITNLSRTGSTNLGPGSADITYGGRSLAQQRAAWTRLAHTLKARFYLHTAEVRPGAYAQALAESKLGLMDPADNYIAQFSGNSGEQNFYYQFESDRPGQLAAGPFLVNLLETRNDPRLSTYFNADQTDLSDAMVAPDASMPLVTAQENLLIEAETAYRGGDQATARSALNQEQTIEGVPLTASSVSGTALLQEILTEKYIALFATIEPWNDYKRTCFPNIAPPSTARGKKFPARLLYDANERQTNTNIPGAQAQPPRNANDPANTQDPFGNVCLGQ
jgi:hypothetical protein